MPAKIMRFFKKPSGILAVLMAVALLGTSSLYAMRTFAEGDVPTIPDDILASNYTQVTVDHMFAESWYDYVQVYCSEADTVEKELSYRGSVSSFNSSELYDGEKPFDIYMYDTDNNGYTDENYSSSSLKYTGEIPGKTYYVYQEMYDYDTGNYGYCYVGSFNINQYESMRDPRGYSETKGVVSAVTLDTTGADCEFSQDEWPTVCETPAEIIHHKDPRTTWEYDSESGQWVEVPETESVWNEETGAYEEVQLYDEYDEYNFGESLPNSHSEMLAKAGVDLTDEDVTLSFFGRKERTYYKYGNRVPISQDDYRYARNIPVIVPKDSSKGSEVFIGFLDDGDTDSDAIGRGSMQTFSIRSVTGILGIPGDAGTVITYERDYGKVYLPVKVNLTYDNSSWESVEHAFIRPNDVLNGTVDTEYDNTTDSCMIDGGLKGNAYFQLHNNSGTPPQMFYDENDEYSSAGDIPETTWNDNQLTQTTSMWQLAGDDSTTFSVNGTTPIKNIFKENQYTVSGGPVLTFNVNLKSQFRIPGTYSLVYNLNKPKPSLTVTNEASFATVENITKGLVKNGEYTLAGAKPEISGYTFKGWTLNGQSGTFSKGAAIPFSCFDNEDSTATATANWEINKHNVTYNVSGEKPEGYEKPADQSNVEFDTEVTVADVPSYDGYSFSGWYVSGATPDENGKFNMPDQDVTIYGTFTELRYGLDYIENAPDGKTVTGMPQNATNIRYSDVKDGAYTLSATAPDCGEGYRFLGWKLNKTSGNQAAGAAVPFENFDVEGRTATATAQWEEIPKHNVAYTVNKPANSDDITYTAPEAASYYEGTENISVADVPAAGTDYNSARYSFNGWNTSDVTVTGGKFTMPTDNVNFTGTFTKRSYSVSYSVTGAPDGYTTPTGDTYEVDVNVPVASVPAEGDYPGYTFTGWKKGDDFVSGSFTMPAEAVTLTGVFEKIPYHVTYSVTGAPDGYSVPTDGNDHYVTDPVTVAATPNIPGYTFTGWKKDGTVVTSFNMPASDVELTGVFEKIPYHVTYSVTGAPEGYSVPTDGANYYVTDPVTVKETPVISGYDFEGWKKDGTVVTSFDMPASNVELTGVFTKKSYTVSYSVTGNVPDGWTAPESHSEEYKATVTPKAVSAYDTSRYIFEGWKKDGVVVYSFEMPAADVELTGVFSENDKITLRYDANRGNGSDIINSLTKSEYNKVTETIAALPAEITREGYTFANKWSLNPDGTGTLYNVGATDQEFTTDTTLYAVWNENTYALDYQDGGKAGATIPADEPSLNYSVVKDGYALSSTEPTVNGAKFKSWLVDGTEYQPGDTIPFSAFSNNDKTAVAVAQWTDWTYHVIYKPGTGHEAATNMPEDKDYDYGDVHLAPYPTISTQQPVHAGFTFTGRDVAKKDNVSRFYSVAELEDDSVSKEITDADFPEGTLTIIVTAMWEAIPEPTYTVTYKVTSTDPAADKYTLPTDTNAYHEGDSVTVENVLSVEGYTFDGWYKGTEKVTSFEMPAENVELTGSFTKNPEPEPTYTIRYHANGKPDGHYSDVDVNTSSVPADAVLNADDLEDGYTLTGSYGSDDAPKSVDGEFDFVCWCRTPAHSADGIITTAVLGDFGTDNVLDVYAVWIKHVEVEYDKGEPAANVGGIVKATEVFDLNIKTLQYTVKSIEELGPAFRFDNYKFDYWLVVSTEKPIIRHKQPSSGASSESVRTYANGSTETITVDGKLYHGDKLSLEGDVKLTAIWKSKITLTYNANGGSPVNKVPNQGNPIDHWTDDTVTVQSGDALKNGDQVFKYWSTTANDETGSKHYKTGNTFTITENTVLYAIYDDAPGSDSGKEYTVTYDKNGGTGTEPKDENKYSGGETVTVKDKGDLVRTDCTFKEWNTKKDGTGTGYKGDGTDSFTMPESDVTLYAIWTDSNGNIVSPGTGESDVPMMIAINLALLSMVAVAFVVIKQQIRRKETAK